MVLIKSRRDLRAWLEKQPEDVACELAAVISLRIGLRVLPLVMNPAHYLTKEVHGPRWLYILLSLRTLVLARGGYRYRQTTRDFRAVGEAASTAYKVFTAYSLGAVPGNALYSTIMAARATEAALNVNCDAALDYTARVASADAYVIESDAETWKAINVDCSWIEAGWTADRLSTLPLWPDGLMPLSMTLQILEEEASLWSNWGRWFAKRLQGSASDWGLPPKQDAEMARRLMMPDEPEFWEKGEKVPAYVNAAIGDWLEELQPKSDEEWLAALLDALAAGWHPDFSSPEARETQAALLDEISAARAAIASQPRTTREESRHGVGGNNPPGEAVEPITDGETLLVRFGERLAEIDQHLASAEAEAIKPEPDVEVLVKEGMWFQRRLAAISGAEDEFWKEFGKTAGKAAGGGSVLLVGGVFVTLIGLLRAYFGF